MNLYGLPLFQDDDTPASPAPIPADTVILLDLNFTLVENSLEKKRQRGTYADKILREVYRQWLVDMIRPYHVILCTVRGEAFKAATLANIAASCNGWTPQESYFNPNPAQWRGNVVKVTFLPSIIAKHPGQPMLAIESATATRGMFARNGIPAAPQQTIRESGLIVPSIPKLRSDPCN